MFFVTFCGIVDGVTVGLVCEWTEEWILCGGLNQSLHLDLWTDRCACNSNQLVAHGRLPLQDAHAVGRVTQRPCRCLEKSTLGLSVAIAAFLSLLKALGNGHFAVVATITAFILLKVLTIFFHGPFCPEHGPGFRFYVPDQYDRQI